MIRAVVGLLGVSGLLLALVAAKTAEEGRLRETLDGHAACEAAVATVDPTASAVRCSTAVAAAHAAKLRAEACDQALLGGDLFVMRASCSTEVKTLFAAREAETRRADSLAEVLSEERAGQAAAITRAESRARTQAERTQRAQSTLRDAPRRGDLVVLDAERLRQLGDADTAPDQP